MALAVLTGCGGGGSAPSLPLMWPSAPTEPDAPVAAKARTTVLIYINGSDLESGLRKDEDGDWVRVHEGGAATNNIQEMLQARFGADVNVVLETGGTFKEGWDTRRRMQVKDQQLIDLPTPALTMASMVDPATLRDFVTWGARAFPAQQYVLLFWNHGGGPNGGYGVDQITTHDGRVSMPVTSIQSALDSAVAEIGQKFELIGFDACLMGNLEIASALSNAGNYLAASSDVEPGAGWNYRAILNFLGRNPAASGDQLGQRIADSYVAKNEDQADDLTFSVTDLRRVPALQSAIDNLFRGFSTSLQRDGLAAWSPLAAARARTLDFSTDIYHGEHSTDLIDLGSFLNAQALNTLPVGTALAHARQALKEAVVFKRWGLGLEDSSGLTMYFPAQTLRSEDAKQQYQSDSAASATLKQFHLDYVNFALDGHVPTPVVGQPTVLAGGGLYSTLSNQLYESSYGVLQDPSGAIISTQAAETAQNGVSLPTPDRWPTLKGVPLLMASAFDPTRASAEFMVPAKLAADCIAPQDQIPLEHAARYVGYLVVQKTGEGANAQYRVAGHHHHTGSSLHGLASRLMPVVPGTCFALPQLRYDQDNQLLYEFTQARFVQLNATSELTLQFTPTDLTGHSIYTAVNDYTGQLQYSTAPARY